MTNTQWSSTDSLHTTVTGSGLIATSNSGNAAVRGQNALILGKYYWEYTFTTAANTDTGVGIATSSAPLTSLGSNATGACIIYKGFAVFLNGSNQGTTIGTITTGSVVAIACDFANRLIWFRLGASGSWNATSGSANNPATGTGGISFAALSGPFFPAASMWATSDAITANFGDTSFTGTVPSGFTSGLPLPPNYALATQVAVEQWIATNAAAQVTQVAVEEWGVLPPPPLWITQAGAFDWVTNTHAPFQVTQAGAFAWIDTTKTNIYPIGVSATGSVGSLTTSISGQSTLVGVTTTAAAGSLRETIVYTLASTSFVGSVGDIDKSVVAPNANVNLEGVSANWQAGSLAPPKFASLFGTVSQFALTGAYLYNDLANSTGGFASSLPPSLFNSFSTGGIVTASVITSIALSNTSFAGGSPNNTTVGTVSVALNSGTFTGTLALSGTNAANFHISGNTLLTVGILPAGAYSLIITAAQTGIDSYAQTFAITATAAPQTITNIALSTTTFTGNSPSGTTVAAISVTMNTGVFSGSLSLTGANAVNFAIVGSNLVTNGVTANGTYNINVIATQLGATGSPFTKAFTLTGITVMSNITLSNSSFVGGSPNNTTIGAISVTLSTGVFAGTLTLSGTNASLFKITGSNLVTKGVVPTGNYSINITATQAGIQGSPLLRTFAITATVAPPVMINMTLVPSSFVAGSPSGTVVGLITPQLSSGSFTGTLSLSGTNASSFRIVGSNLVTFGVLGLGTYNINIIATQAGATGSPYTKAFTVTSITSITNITLSNASFTGGAPRNTIVGTIAVTMSTGAFSGTLSLSGANAGSFHISGSNLLTTGVVIAGSYAINIIATQASASGSPFTKAFGITGTGISAPTQAAAAGYTSLVFSDDFTTTTTIAPTGTASTGYKWYWGHAVDFWITSRSWSVDTSGTGILNLNSIRASDPSYWGNSTLTTLPGRVITDGVVPPGTAWQHGYFEAYVQMTPAASPRLQANGWPAFWSWGAEGAGNFGFGDQTNLMAPVSEIDFMESTGNVTFTGGTDPFGEDQANVFNPAGTTNVVNQLYPTLDTNWHKFGCLWKPGTVQFFYDDIPQGAAHSTTAWNLEGTHLFLVLGTGIGWPLNVDWVRVWQ